MGTNVTSVPQSTRSGCKVQVCVCMRHACVHSSFLRLKLLVPVSNATSVLYATLSGCKVQVCVCMRLACVHIGCLSNLNR